jgi:putative ABC transport system permease protein
MIGHLLKLAWRRKSSSALLLVELLASFVVVFVVATSVLYLALCWRLPLGYDWRGVWSVEIDRMKTTDDTWTPEEVQGYARLLREGAAIEGIQAIAGSMNAPYDFSTSSGTRTFGNHEVTMEFAEFTDGVREVLHLDVVKGRWFEPADDALPWSPVVVDEQFAREAFGDEDPIGKVFSAPPDSRDERIVGVVHDYRKGGELAVPGAFVMHRTPIGREDVRPPQVLLVRAAPHVDEGFEERLVTRLHAIMPEWTFAARPLEDLRARSFQARLVPLVLGATIAGFLLLMVALGLIGVLWQNVTRRTREFGLRRAAGASQGDIRRQVIMEVVLTAAFALGIGTILAAQIPFLGIVPFVGAGTIAAGVIIASILVVATVIAAGLYPSVLATRIRPAEALRDE